MAEDVGAKEAKFVALQEKKAEEAKEKKAEVELGKVEAKKTEDKKDSAKGKTKESSKEGKDALAKPAGKKEETKKEDKKEEKEIKKREITLERIYTVPFIQVYSKPQQLRSNAAILELQRFMARHMKTDISKVKISLIVNNMIRKRGGGRPMKKIKVKATKDKEGIVLVEHT